MTCRRCKKYPVCCRAFVCDDCSLDMRTARPRVASEHAYYYYRNKRRALAGLQNFLAELADPNYPHRTNGYPRRTTLLEAR